MRYPAPFPDDDSDPASRQWDLAALATLGPQSPLNGPQGDERGGGVQRPFVVGAIPLVPF